METVKGFREWCVSTGMTQSASHCTVWIAAQANMPIKTCEWTKIGNDWESGCGHTHFDNPFTRGIATAMNCIDCGGKVTIKQTTAQKLETAELHLAQLVGAIKILSSKSVTVETDYDHLLNYIKQNGLDK